VKKQQATTTIDESLIAIAERHSDLWRVMLVRRGERPVALQTREFGRADESGLASWLESQRCGDLRVILPASACIVRSTSMPAAAPQQMAAALRLQAEGMFLGSMPMCRIGLAILEGADDGDRQGVIMAWPEAQLGVGLGAKLESIARYIPEPAAMLLLATGDRPAILADRSMGSIAIAMRTGSGLVIRATREDAPNDVDGDDGWTAGLRRAIVETALNGKMDPSRIGAFADDSLASLSRDGDRVSALDPAIRSVLESRVNCSVAGSDDDAWWLSWATVLAAACVATGPLSDLSKLRRFEERAKPSRIERFIERYSSPPRAAAVAALAFAIIALAPVGSAWLRGFILEMKMPESARLFESSQRQIEQRIALYGEISKRNLPVAKILGDLACCTPDGIEIESIQISGTQGLTVRGVAKAQGERSAAESVNQMAKLMDGSGVFRQTHWRWNVPDGRGLFKFDLDAQIVGPSRTATIDKDKDWAEMTLAERKYGKQEAGAAGSSAASAGSGASSRETTPPADDSKADSALAAGNGESDGSVAGSAIASSAAGAMRNPPRGPEASANTEVAASTPPAEAPAANRGIGRREGAGATPASSGGENGRPVTAPSGAGAGGGPAATALANTPVPDPVTDAQLSAMSKEELRTLLSDISKARRRKDLDSDTLKRLADDFDRILQQLKKN